jgi:hypothetical protein
VDKPALYDEALEGCYSPTGLPTTGCCSFLGEAELLTAGVCLAHVLGERDQLLDHLRCLDRAVLIAADGLLQHLGEGTRLDDVLATPRGQLALQELLEQFCGQIAVGLAAHFGEELIQEGRDVWFLQSCRRKDFDSFASSPCQLNTEKLLQLSHLPAVETLFRGITTRNPGQFTAARPRKGRS